MFGTDTYSPKPNTLFEPRPLRTTSIHPVLSSIEEFELAIQEPYYESYIWWTNPENLVTREDITILYRYKYGENLTYDTPSEKSNSIAYTKYLATEGISSRNFEIPEVWGANKR